MDYFVTLLLLLQVDDVKEREGINKVGDSDGDTEKHYYRQTIAGTTNV
jgi:hypothetical protein